MHGLISPLAYAPLNTIDHNNYGILTSTITWPQLRYTFTVCAINGLLVTQMGSVDKDFRFMATNDLMTELQKDSIKLDDDSEKKVVQSVLKLVEDKNGEVQNLAVKW